MSIFSLVVILLPFQTSPKPPEKTTSRRSVRWRRARVRPRQSQSPCPWSQNSHRWGRGCMRQAPHKLQLGTARGAPGFSIPTGPACFGTGEI